MLKNLRLPTGSFFLREKDATYYCRTAHMYIIHFHHITLMHDIQKLLQFSHCTEDTWILHAIISWHVKGLDWIYGWLNCFCLMLLCKCTNVCLRPVRPKANFFWLAEVVDIGCDIEKPKKQKSESGPGRFRFCKRIANISIQHTVLCWNYITSKSTR